MKKLITLILVLVLAVSLSTTAFADNSTPVYFKADSTQISVTVPTKIVGSVAADTGVITFATTGYLENTCKLPVKVSSVVSTIVTDSGWVLATEAGTGNNTIVADMTPSATAASKIALSGTASPSGTAWNMAATDGTAGSGGDYIALTLSGTVYKLTKALTAADETPAFNIVFTVEAGAHSA